MSAFKLEARSIRKVYPGTVALNDVSIGFEGGKIHALIGKNGAGKSTLVKIISGAIQPTAGTIVIEGRDVQLRSPRDAFREGIATVYQELSLVPELSVGENILFGRLPKRKWSRGLVVDWEGVFHGAGVLLSEMRVGLDVRSKVRQLGVAQQQVVEIAKAMSFNPSVLVLDEPTSALAHHEVRTLFELIRGLAARGVAIVYITHRLQELEAVADVVSVLRDGNLIGTIGIDEARPEIIARMMFGELIRKVRPTGLEVHRQPVLEVRHLKKAGELYDINFTLYRGEVLGIAGMLGSGRTELLRAIFGSDTIDSGEIVVGGRSIARPSPARMKRLGLGLTPEDRKEEGLIPLLTVRDNVCLASLGRLSLRGLIRKGRQRAVARKTVDQLRIAVSDVEQPVASLSGGNQQKVVVGNWLNTEPLVMLFDEPTRGIDVQAKQQMFQIIWDLSRRGISSIVVSSELEELIEVCHRILIMRNGRIVEEVGAEAAQLDRVLELSMKG